MTHILVNGKRVELDEIRRMHFLERERVIVLGLLAALEAAEARIVELEHARLTLLSMASR